MSRLALYIDLLVGWVQQSSARETAATLVVILVLTLALIEAGRGVVWLCTHATADRPEWWVRWRRPREFRETAAERQAAVLRAAIRKRRADERALAELARAPQDVHDRVITGLEVYVLDMQGFANEHAEATR